MSDYLARVVAHGAELPGAILPRPVTIFEAAPPEAALEIAHDGDASLATAKLPMLAPGPSPRRQEDRHVHPEAPVLATTPPVTPVPRAPRRLQAPTAVPTLRPPRQPLIADEPAATRSNARSAPELRGTDPPLPRRSAAANRSNPPIVPPAVERPPVQRTTLLPVPNAVASDHRPEPQRIPARLRTGADEAGSASPLHQGDRTEPSRITPPEPRPASQPRVVISRPTERIHRGEGAAPSAAVPTTIQVTIGRVEVRVAGPAGPTGSKKRNSTRPPSVMSLDEYLKQRASRGSR